MPQSATAAGDATRGRSWMLPEAKGDDLLYLVSNGDNATYVYSYPTAKLVGTLVGGGQYACADKAGDVFIASEAGLTEYLHGGTKPIKSTLSAWLRRWLFG